MGKLVPFGCCALKKLGLELVGVLPAGGSKKQRGCQVTLRGLSESAEGAPPARLARRAGEVEHERTC